MADTTRAIVNFVWKWGFGLFPLKMDTLNTLLVGWIVFAVILIVVGKFVYTRYLSDWSEDFDEEILKFDRVKSDITTAIGAVDPKPEQLRRKAKIVPELPPEKVPPPIATGGDPDAVRWLNNLLVWFYEGSEGGRLVKEAWNDALNDVTVNTALETGVLVEVLEVLPQTPAPHLSNVVVDCEATDDMSLSCDIETNIFLRVQTTRTQKEVTMESEYACAVRPLRGRFNAEIKTHECSTVLKLVGWPEIFVELEGVRNNATGLDEDQLQEVLKEVLTNALRGVILKLDFSGNRLFPRFKRARQNPDPVIPIGYDSLVREAQTHPPSSPYKIPPSITPLQPAPSIPSQTLTSPKFQVLYDKPTSSGAQISSNSSPVSSPNTAVLALSHSSLQTNPSQVCDAFLKPYDTRQRNDSGSTDEEVIEEAGESFTSLYIPSQPIIGRRSRSSDRMSNGRASPSTVLTPSEESLIARNIDKYERKGSSPDVDLARVLAKYSEGKRRPSPSPERPARRRINGFSDQLTNPISILKHRSASRSPPRRSVKRDAIIRSSREKPIDEPTTIRSDGYLDSEMEEDPTLLQSSWKSFPHRSDDDSLEDDPASLKKILQNANSFQTALHNLDPSSSGRFLQETPSPAGYIGLAGKRLLVKVVKASNIGGHKPICGSCVVIEMDDPPQKFTTAVVKDESSPFWDEQFLFDLTENTLELLFEVFADERFLGLGIVGIEELVATPSQRQVINLQGRPYESDEVSGSITCEFLFLDRADLPDLTFHATSNSLTNYSNDGLGAITNNAYSKGPNISDKGEIGGVPESDLEDRHGNLLQQTQSPLSIHASRKESTRLVIQVTRTPSGEYSELPNGDLQPMEDPDTDVYHRPLPSVGIVRAPSPRRAVFPPPASPSDRISTPTEDRNCIAMQTDDRGRSRNRSKKDFFGSLRKRFSRSTNRSQSMEPGAPGRALSQDKDPLAGRSISVERATRSRSRGLLSVPGLRISSVGGHRGESGSARSSLSGTSGVSSASTKTYINEASLMVVETFENGVITHYLVPISLQRKNKWRRKGTKLHIYNEHCFVARHMASSTVCEVCSKSLGRRFGKQGYECRDCAFRCHKPCHVKVDSICPNSTVNAMDLVCVKDEKASRQSITRISS